MDIKKFARLHAHGNNFPLIEFKNVENVENSVDKSYVEIAHEVIKGLWGNGNERKQRLTNAGYNYDTVQEIVNKLLKENINTKSNEEIAHEVIKGLWGNGNERKQRLSNAGYNYKVIQTIVNKLLK